MPLIVFLTIDIKNDNSTRSMANIALELKSVVKNISTVPLNSLEIALVRISVLKSTISSLISS